MGNRKVEILMKKYLVILKERGIEIEADGNTMDIERGLLFFTINEIIIACFNWNNIMGFYEIHATEHERVKEKDE